MAARMSMALPPEYDTSRPSCLSTTAQTRILVWRSEVASAFDPPPSPPSSTSTPSVPSASSSSTTTTITTTASSLLPRASRGRRIWRRIVRRLSSRSDADSGAANALAAEAGLATGPEEVIRTAMYRSTIPPEDPYFDMIAGEARSELVDSKGGLQDKQNRLYRASKLLQQQHAMGIPSTMSP
ncbi:hypothetical protein HIM_03897 [Hirsutella minnesotensis 3608]|uniref:Uncharacterized protein n=1 Tax=Hirsutella minnesotensis 3608 TaxID=1043627 RepID=A0A0F7ZLN1_9HYPO|nr:hypothetical protein HIM_03897 [Hirsutella minnesotensis 3608]